MFSFLCVCVVVDPSAGVFACACGAVGVHLSAPSSSSLSDFCFCPLPSPAVLRAVALFLSPARSTIILLNAPGTPSPLFVLFVFFSFLDARFRGSRRPCDLSLASIGLFCARRSLRRDCPPPPHTLLPRHLLSWTNQRGETQEEPVSPSSHPPLPRAGHRSFSFLSFLVLTRSCPRSRVHGRLARLV